MGNRDKLLAGARRLIAEKGYADITARDLVAASETNLASIGYHFGSKDALLTEAVLDSFGAWGNQLEEAISSITSKDPVERLSAVLDAVAEVFAQGPAITTASVEAFARSPHSPEIRLKLAEAYQSSRAHLAAAILGTDTETDTDHIGSLGLALIDGIALQWLVDPENAPTGREIATALRALTTR